MKSGGREELLGLETNGLGFSTGDTRPPRRHEISPPSTAERKGQMLEEATRSISRHCGAAACGARQLFLRCEQRGTLQRSSFSALMKSTTAVVSRGRSLCGCQIGDGGRLFRLHRSLYTLGKLKGHGSEIDKGQLQPIAMNCKHALPPHRAAALLMLLLWFGGSVFSRTSPPYYKLKTTAAVIGGRGESVRHSLGFVGLTNVRCPLLTSQAMCETRLTRGKQTLRGLECIIVDVNECGSRYDVQREEFRRQDRHWHDVSIERGACPRLAGSLRHGRGPTAITSAKRESWW